MTTVSAVDTPPSRAQPKRATSNLGTRRDKFLRSLGIPSFQHAIGQKSTPYASTGVNLEPPPSEGLTTSRSTPLDLHITGTAVPEKAKDTTIDMGNGDLLSPLDTDKRFSSIRLRNYKSIGNLDQQARDDGLFGSNQNVGDKPSDSRGGMTVSQSMPLATGHYVQNEEMEGKLFSHCTTSPAFAGNLATIHVSSVVPNESGLAGTATSREVVVLLEVPGGQQSLVKTNQEVATLHEGLVDWQRTNGHLRDLYIPDLPRSVRGASASPVNRTGSSLSQASNASPESTTSQAPSNGSKKRHGSFLSNLQNKMKSTIRAVSEGSRSGATSPVSQMGSPRLLTPGPLSPALTPSNSLDQVTSLNIGLGKFDFEEKASPIVDRFATPENRLSSERATDPQAKGLTLDSAAALVTAMTADERFAKMASRPSSIVVKSGGLYGKDTPAGTLLPSPLLSPQGASTQQPQRHQDRQSGGPSDDLARPRNSEDDNKELSTYLNLLAQQTSIRASLPWMEFFGVAGTSVKPSGRKIGWDDETEERLERDRQRLELNKMNSTQRRSMIRKSRSLGEGLLSLFASGDKPDSAPTMPASSSLDTVPVPSDSVVPTARDTAPLDTSQENIEPKLDVAPPQEEDARSPTPMGVPSGLATPDETGHGGQSDEAVEPDTSDVTVILPPSPETQPMPIPETPQAGPRKRKHPGRKTTSVDDFELIRVLGKGCAGKVVLVKHKRSGGLYAMKAIMKRHVLAHQELAHTLTEQSVLRRMSSDELSNPFIVKLWWSFHDVDNLYLVLDFLPGGDLATQLSRWGRLGRDRARFYTCEIVEGVEALHAAGIIYRDLKPENILLGSDGHISLADFGLAAEFPESKGPLAAAPPWMTGSSLSTISQDPSGGADPLSAARDHAASFVGTAEYLAPEVIKGLPYSYEVDWWALGTMLYEALIGNTPFWVDNHAEMYMRVVNEELRFPEDRVLDKETKSFIRGLLQKDPMFRLCEPRIRKHPYLAMVDWDHVKHKRYIPPYIPPTDKSLEYDFQNFDANFLEMDPALRAETASTSGGSEGEHTDKDAFAEADENAFDGYLYKHHEIVSVVDPDLSGLDELAGDDGQTVVEPAVGDTEPSSPSSSETGTELEDPVPDTTVTSTPTVEASTAMLQRIQALTNEASAANVKTSRHSREIMNRGSMDRISRTLASEDDHDDEWDIIEDDPDAVATNGRDTLFARGVVDKYRLAVLKRRESTVRRKPSVKFKRSSPGSSQILGRAGDEVPPLPTTPRPSGLKYRLRNRMKTPKSQPGDASPSGSSTPNGLLRQPPAIRSESTQSVNSAWSTENGSDGAMSLDSHLTTRVQQDVRRGSAGV